jgi:phosphoribosylanthranilate isomerase
MAAPEVKICGIVRPVDAELAVELGARAIGLNLVAGTPRCLTIDEAKALVELVRRADATVEVVLVVANEPFARLEEVRRATGASWLQLSGDESIADLERVLPHAYKGVRIANEEDARAAAAYPGEHLLVDAKVAGALGGTGKSFDWRLVVDLAARRKLTLAGGLHPGNVAEAVALVRPFRIDLASGVEVTGKPREKDAAKMRALFDALRT